MPAENEEQSHHPPTSGHWLGFPDAPHTLAELRVALSHCQPWAPPYPPHSRGEWRPRWLSPSFPMWQSFSVTAQVTTTTGNVIMQSHFSA